MKPITKQILLVSGVMIIGGTLLTGIGTALGGHPGVQISKNGIHSPYRQQEPYKLKKTKIDAFTTLNLHIETYTNVKIEASEDEYFYLEYTLDGTDNAPEYKVKENTLTFTHTSPHIIQFVGLHFNYIPEVNSYLTLYLPKGHALTDVDITLSGGDLAIDDLVSDTASFDLEYGDFNLNHAKFGKTDLQMGYGEMSADSLIADSLTADCEYADAVLSDFTCQNAEFTFEFGDITVNATQSEHISINTEYGNIKLTLKEPYDSYTVNASTEYGSIRLSEAIKGLGTAAFNEEDDFISYQKSGNTDKTVTLSTEDGDIILDGAKK